MTSNQKPTPRAAGALEGVSAQATNKAKDKIKEPHHYGSNPQCGFYVHAAHIMPRFAFTMVSNVIETHEHKGDFRKP